MFLTLTLAMGYYQFNCPVFTGCPVKPTDLSSTLIAAYFLWNFGIVYPLLSCFNVDSNFRSCFLRFVGLTSTATSGRVLLASLVQHRSATLCYNLHHAQERFSSKIMTALHCSHKLFCSPSVLPSGGRAGSSKGSIFDS